MDPMIGGLFRGAMPLRILSAIAWSWLLAACTRETAPEAAPASVDIATPLQRTVVDRDSFPGRFDAVNSVEVRARVGGFVDVVAFKDGDYVHKGDLLFQIDPRPFVAAVTEEQGHLAEAHSQRTLADRELERAKSLIATQTIAPDLYERRQQAAEAAEAAVQVAKGRLQQAQLNLDYARVRAPMDGRISRRLVSAGNLVQGGGANATLLTSIVSTDPIDFYFDIDERSFVRYGALVQHSSREIGTGESRVVLIALSGQAAAKLTANLNFVDNRLDRSTGTVRVRARLANPTSSLSPGQFGRALIASGLRHPAEFVPDSVLITQATGKVVAVVGADNKVQEREVSLGGLFGSMREIRSGLKSDDHVIVAGLQRAQVGQTVRPRLITLVPTGFGPQELGQ
jgi:RND family efflux transporter MFP subunit